MKLLRFVIVITSIFVITAVLSLRFGWWAGAAFLILAKFADLIWQSAVRTYRETQAQNTTHKRKRTPGQRLILTDDGEVLDVVDENEPETLRGTHHG